MRWCLRSPGCIYGRTMQMIFHYSFNASSVSHSRAHSALLVAHVQTISVLLRSAAFHLFYSFIFSVLLLHPEDALKYRFIIVCSVTPVSKRRKNSMFLLLFLSFWWWIDSFQLNCVLSAKMKEGPTQSVLAATFPNQKVLLLRQNSF